MNTGDMSLMLIVTGLIIYIIYLKINPLTSKLMNYFDKITDVMFNDDGTRTKNSKYTNINTNTNTNTNTNINTKILENSWSEFVENYKHLPLYVLVPIYLTYLYKKYKKYINFSDVVNFTKRIIPNLINDTKRLNNSNNLNNTNNKNNSNNLHEIHSRSQTNLFCTLIFMDKYVEKENK